MSTENHKPLLTRLSIMMFLQFFIWGAWYLTVSLYMMENGMGDVRFYAYTAGPMGAIIAPFITGLFADRFFNTEKVLAILFLLGGGFMLCLPIIGSMQGEATAFLDGADGAKIASSMTIELFGRTMVKGEVFNYVILAHMVCYMPTLGLTAALCFKHLPNGSQQFPLVRLWGTMGWIIAGLVLALGFGRTIEAGNLPIQFYLGGGCSILLGFYCFSLPKTPAPQKGEPVNVRDLFFLDSWAQLKKPAFAVFMVCAFLLCIPLQAYYANLQQQMVAMGMKNITIWKNVGTWLEAGMMFAMPFFFRRLGVKKMIAIGIGAWVLRYALFSLGATATTSGVVMVIAGIALHGICYDFFFVTGQIYVDEATPETIRGQAQGMNIFFTQGIGMLLGAVAAKKLADRAFDKVASNAPESLPMWPDLWWPLCGMAAGILVVFLLAFHPEKKEASEETPDKPVHGDLA